MYAFQNLILINAHLRVTLITALMTSLETLKWFLLLEMILKWEKER